MLTKYYPTPYSSECRDLVEVCSKGVHTFNHLGDKRIRFDLTQGPQYELGMIRRPGLQSSIVLVAENTKKIPKVEISEECRYKDISWDEIMDIATKFGVDHQPHAIDKEGQFTATFLLRAPAEQNASHKYLTQ